MYYFVTNNEFFLFLWLSCFASTIYESLSTAFWWLWAATTMATHWLSQLNKWYLHVLHEITSSLSYPVYSSPWISFVDWFLIPWFLIPWFSLHISQYITETTTNTQIESKHCIIHISGSVGGISIVCLQPDIYKEKKRIKYTLLLLL